MIGGYFTHFNGEAHSYIARLNVIAAPIISSATNASSQVGQSFSYQISATNNPTGYSASALPPGLSLNPATGLISGVPTTAGSYAVTVSAANASGTGSATLSLTITAAPQPPTITSATTDTATVGQPYGYSITATNSPTAYAASGLPAGLSLNTATGVISGTPAQAGRFGISLVASNAAAGTGPTATLTLTVSPAPDNITGFNILSPPSNSRLVRTDTVYPYVQVQSNPGTLARVDLFADDAGNNNAPIFLGSNTAGLFRLAWMPPHAGAFTLRAVATDTAGSSKTAALPITVVEPPSANPVPAVKLLDGLDATQFSPGDTVTLLAQAGDSDDPLDTITLFADGQVLATFPAAGANALRPTGGGPVAHALGDSRPRGSSHKGF